MKKPIYGLCLCIILVPFWDLQYIVQLPLRLSALNIFYLILLLSIYINHFNLKPKKIDLKNNVFRYIFILIILYLISGIRTYLNPPEYFIDNPINSITNSFVKPMIYISLYFMVKKYFYTKNDIKIIINSIYIGLSIFFISLITSALGIYGSWEYNVGPSGLFTEPIPAGTFLSISLPFIFLMYFEKIYTYLSKNKLLIIIAGSSIFMLLSATRSLYIIFPLMLFALIYNSTRKFNKVLYLIIGFTISSIFIPDYALDRLKGKFIGDSSLITVGSNYDYINHYINGR